MSEDAYHGLPTNKGEAMLEKAMSMQRLRMENEKLYEQLKSAESKAAMYSAADGADRRCVIRVVNEYAGAAKVCGPR